MKNKTEEKTETTKKPLEKEQEMLQHGINIMLYFGLKDDDLSYKQMAENLQNRLRALTKIKG